MKWFPLPIRTIKVCDFELGLHFVDGEFRGVLSPGRYWFIDPLGRVSVDVVSRRQPWLFHEKLDILVRSGQLEGKAEVLDLKDWERALAWVDGRFDRILGPGLYAYWTGFREVRIERVDARNIRLDHPDLAVIARSIGVEQYLELASVAPNHQSVLTVNGVFSAILTPGRYAFWRDAGTVAFVDQDCRDQLLDLTGQEIMTADKVTLRLNGVVTYRVVDLALAVSRFGDLRQALYRDAQLALRTLVGTNDLDAFLLGKDAVAAEWTEALRGRAAEFGIEVRSAGIRDIILPGEMKDLLNKVTEAKKAAEANLIARREETAAIRSQANTAKLLQENATLMRLRELEVLEKVAAGGKLSIVVGDKGLADRVVHLL